jgi:DNA-binding response OmpR family regulator/HPt (histidine-containing phosphotransfer) domain-containing protein
MRILLVEDDESIAQVLVSTLKNQNYLVDVATDGEEGWELVEGCAYDLIVLDVGLPKIDGMTLCRKMRSQGYQMPILLLTARDTTQDKVMGLDAGADDYLVKPCEPQELAARIRALLRRGDSALPPILEWGDLQVNPNTFDVTYDNTPVNLTPTEYRLLELFLRNKTRVYSRSAILDHLWAFDDPPGEETIRAHVKGLRQKLKASGAPGDLIETVYGLGYRLKQLPKTNKITPTIHNILLAGFPDSLGEWLVKIFEHISVEISYTGEETIQKLATDKWSLLIIYEGLREPSVSEVFRLANKKKLLSKIPVIIGQNNLNDSDQRLIIKQIQKLSNPSVINFNINPPIEREKLASQIAEILKIELPKLPLNESQYLITEPVGGRSTSEKKEAKNQQLFQADIHKANKAAIAEIWERFKDRIGHRITVLEQAVIALRGGILNEELRQSATQEAHKLIGSLGTFGFEKGSEIARKIEQIFQQPKVSRENIPNS